MLTMPPASLSPSPVADTTPTTMPTVAQASATGIALCALSASTARILAGPMRVSRRSWLMTKAATRAQKPAKSGERPSTRNQTSTAGPTSRWKSRLRTAPRRGSSLRGSTGSPTRAASKCTMAPTATK